MEMLKAAMTDPTTPSIIANTLNESDPCPSTGDPDKLASDEESVDSDGKSTTETKGNCLKYCIELYNLVGTLRMSLK